MKPGSATHAELLVRDGYALVAIGDTATTATSLLPELRAGDGRAGGLPSPAAKAESKRVLPEKARRELATQRRQVTGHSARVCEKALSSHADDMQRAAHGYPKVLWISSRREMRQGEAGAPDRR